VTSDDQRSQAERDRSEALQLAAFLRSLEQEYADPERRGPLRQSVRGTVDKVLIAAIRLLHPDHWVMALLNDLLGSLIREDADFRLMHENSAYVARALEDRFTCFLPLPEAQDAQEVAGFLRELQQKCQDRCRDSELLQDIVQQVLRERLTKAKALLGEGHWMVTHLEELCGELEHGTATLGLAREDVGYVASVLEAKFELYGGGSYGDTSLNIKHLGLSSWKAFGSPIFMLWLVALAQRREPGQGRARIYERPHHTRLLAWQEPHQYHHSGERG
jgi:hypothetical protein